jgi:hypothetical protein
MHWSFRGDGDASHGRSGVFRDGFLVLNAWFVFLLLHHVIASLLHCILCCFSNMPFLLM